MASQESGVIEAASGGGLQVSTASGAAASADGQLPAAPPGSGGREGWVVPAGLGIGDGLVVVLPQALDASEMRRRQRTGNRGFTGDLHPGLDERRDGPPRRTSGRAGPHADGVILGHRNASGESHRSC
jgi:hypothetical protein